MHMRILTIRKRKNFLIYTPSELKYIKLTELLNHRKEICHRYSLRPTFPCLTRRAGIWKPSIFWRCFARYQRSGNSFRNTAVSFLFRVYLFNFLFFSWTAYAQKYNSTAFQQMRMCKFRVLFVTSS